MMSKHEMIRCEKKMTGEKEKGENFSYLLP